MVTEGGKEELDRAIQLIESIKGGTSSSSKEVVVHHLSTSPEGLRPARFSNR